MNPIFKENQKSGTNSWQLNKPALHREIEGYASQCSINIGDSISFYVNTAAESYSLTLFRMGWYAGSGGRKIAEPIILNGVEQNIPIPDNETGLVECNWSQGYILQTNTDFTSGIYLAKLEELENNHQSYVIFVVRNDNQIRDILFQLPMTTYQAYNYWGGKNLYEFGSGSQTNWGAVTGEPATKVSFNRPYSRSNNPKAAHGMGAGDFFTNTRPVTTHNYPISSAGWDYNMVRYLEKNNYNVAYSTSIDTHRNEHLYEKTKVFLAHGHDEYWTDEMRTNVTVARDKGTHLAFISSNTMFWQIRLEESTIDKIPNRTIICYKNSDRDPIKGKRSTINFRDIPEYGSEAALIGINYILDPVFGDIKVSNTDHWIFKKTNLKKGDRLKGLLGYEVDALANSSPSNTIVLAESPCKDEHINSHVENIKYMFRKVAKIIGGPFEKSIGLKPSNTIAALIALGLTTIVLAFLVLPKVLPYLLGIAALIILAFVVWFIKIVTSGNVVSSHMTIYETKSGGLVFATGSMQWSWGLDDFNAPHLRKNYRNKNAEIITANLFAKLGAKSFKSDE